MYKCINDICDIGIDKYLTVFLVIYILSIHQYISLVTRLLELYPQFHSSKQTYKISFHAVQIHFTVLLNVKKTLLYFQVIWLVTFCRTFLALFKPNQTERKPLQSGFMEFTEQNPQHKTLN